MFGVLTASCLFFSLAGCQKPADQQAATDATSSGSEAARSEAAKSEPKKLFESKPIIVPADTEITVVLDQTLGSKTSTSGQTFSATVHAPIEVERQIAVPQGAPPSPILQNPN